MGLYYDISLESTFQEKKSSKWSLGTCLLRRDSNRVKTSVKRLIEFTTIRGNYQLTKTLV